MHCRSPSNFVKKKVRLVTTALLDIVQLQPCLRKTQRILSVREIKDNLLPLTLKGTSDVLKTSIESLQIRLPSKLRLLMSQDQGFEVTLLTSLNNSRRRETEIPV